jgi:Ca2+-dependent lipid-binding protein
LVIEEANLTNDTEIFSKMDPYCKIKFMGKKYRTPTKNEAGKKPVWKFKMELYIKDMNEEISFKVMDDDTFKDDIVGGHTCRIKDLLGKSDYEHTKWLNLVHDGRKAAGELCIKSQFTFPPGYYQDSSQLIN